MIPDLVLLLGPLRLPTTAKGASRFLNRHTVCPRSLSFLLFLSILISLSLSFSRTFYGVFLVFSFAVEAIKRELTEQFFTYKKTYLFGLSLSVYSSPMAVNLTTLWAISPDLLDTLWCEVSTWMTS